MRSIANLRGILVLLTLGLTLVACGGGGGGSGDVLPALVPSGTTAPAPGTGDDPGGGGGDDGGVVSLTFRVLETGGVSAITAGELAVARDWPAYGALWARHHPPMPPGIGAPDVAPPQVDFTREIVVGIFLGSRPTTGYSASLLAVDRNGDGATVAWEERQPGANCVVGMAVTSPYVLVAITRVSGAIDFNGKMTVVDCP